ncbi:hypothetical protein RUL31_06615 [Bacillus atrophaeus]|uniref:hypothetical protein n=1 Tax=Bacillus atrophaeus TaxID=1452 RepID=UPI0028F72146|nr:hypothetical protein [Bacillus atrophaeus]WNV80947.1 hypothetical protein RUL31_06615 [Bacillus atrophaeus]
MKNKAVLMSILSLSLLTTSISPSLASAKNTETTQTKSSMILYQDEFVQNMDGEKTTVRTVEDVDTITTTFKSQKGTQEFKTDKDSGKITVSSNYLSDAAVKENEEQVNQIANQFVDDNKEAITSNNASLSKVNSDSIDIQKRKGKWAWSKWEKYRIRVEDKATTGIITAAILARIPYIGWIAGAAAGIYIQYKMKTGYFSVKYGTAADTNQCYLWSKKRVKLFQDSKRKKLKLDETSSPWKVYMCGTG